MNHNEEHNDHQTTIQSQYNEEIQSHQESWNIRRGFLVQSIFPVHGISARKAYLRCVTLSCLEPPLYNGVCQERIVLRV